MEGSSTASVVVADAEGGTILLTMVDPADDTRAMTAPPTLSWDDPRLGVKREAPWIAKRRLLQSWWREHELHAAPAMVPRRRFPVGNQIDPADVADDRSLNFLNEAAHQHAEARAVEVQAEAGTLDSERLFGNLLSSMPLCFNIFGALRDEPAFLPLVQQLFAPTAVSVDAVVCEWRPRPKIDFLDDNTAFDAAIWFTDDQGRSCLLGVEVKYTDSFSTKLYGYVPHRDATLASGWFAEGTFEQMSRSVPANQLWRNLLLAASLESSKAKAHRVQWAGVVVLSLAADHGAAKAIAEVEPLLVDGAKDRLRRVTLEDLVATAAGHEDLAAWADLFRRRYLAEPKTL